MRISQITGNNKRPPIWRFFILHMINDKIARNIATGVQHLLQTRREFNLAGEIFSLQATPKQMEHQ